MEAVFIIALRLVLPLVILRFPLLGVLVCAAVDVADYSFIGGHEWYHAADKLLDIYYLSFAAFVVLRWRDPIARKLALGAYVYRFVGVAASLALDQRWLLVVFPNFFEPFFIFYLLFTYLSRSTKLMTSWWVAAAVVVTLLVPKLVQEYVLHVYQPSGRVAPAWIVAAIEQWAWAMVPLYVIPPAMVVAFVVVRARKTSNLAGHF